MAVIYRKKIVAGLLTIDKVPSLFREKTHTEVVRYYVEEIQEGNITIDDVRDEWKEEVQAAFDEASAE